MALDIKYNVYYSTSPTGPWTLDNPVPLDNVQGGTGYTITGLKKGAIYYVSIVGGIMQDGEFVPLMSQPIRPGPMQASGIGEAPMNPIMVKEYISLFRKLRQLKSLKDL